MKIFLTGSAGYVGSHVLSELLKSSHPIWNVDNLSNSSPQSFARVEALTGCGIDFDCIDIRDFASISCKLDEFRPDIIIHFAGLKSVGDSISQPLSYYENNVCGTLNLLKAMDNVGCSNIVFSSSATVYGQPERLPLTEDHRVAPLNPYGRTKLFIEDMIKDWCATDPCKSAVLLRYFNPVGAHPSGEIGESPTGVPNNLMPYMSQVAVGKRDFLSVFGQDYNTPDGTGVRDYIHVCDLAAGHVAAMNYCLKGQGVDVFNLGTGRGYSVLEMVKAFEKASGQTIPYKIKARRNGDVAECYADVSKAKELLNWEAKLDIDDMCRDAWRWQSQYPDGFEG